MPEIIHTKIKNIPKEHKGNDKEYEYFKRELVPRGYGKQCVVAVYEIPPLKSAVPYHYHTMNEESFLILSGEGILKTKDGDRKIEKGDFLFFPANKSGAHKITNSSASKPLIYIDFDTANPLEVTIYPDSKKIGIWGKDINKIYQEADEVDYYQNEK